MVGGDAKAKSWFWALFAVSMAAGVLVALVSGARLRYQDETDYFNLAVHLLQGAGYVGDDLHATAYRPPGYPFLMTLLAWAPQGVLLLKLLNVACLGAALWLMRAFVLTQAPRVAWMAGGAALLYPVWLYTASTLYPQTVCLALLLGLLLLLTRTGEGWGRYIVAGLVYGFLVLVAPSFQLLGPVFAGYVLACGGLGWRKNLIAAALFTLATLACMAPWLVRNYQVFGEFVPVATNGGINLLLGNSPHTGPNSGVNVPLAPYLTRVQGLDEVAASRTLQAFAVEWIKAHPVDAASLYVRKAINYYNFRAEPVTGQPHSVLSDVVMALTYYPMLLLAAWRLTRVRTWPLSRVEGLFIAVYVLNGLLAALFFTRIRFRLPFDGLLVVLAIIAIGHLMPAARGAGSGRAHP